MYYQSPQKAQSAQRTTCRSESGKPAAAALFIVQNLSEISLQRMQARQEVVQSLPAAGVRDCRTAPDGSQQESENNFVHCG